MTRTTSFVFKSGLPLIAGATLSAAMLTGLSSVYQPEPPNAPPSETSPSDTERADRADTDPAPWGEEFREALRVYAEDLRERTERIERLASDLEPADKSQPRGPRRRERLGVLDQLDRIDRFAVYRIIADNRPDSPVLGLLDSRPDRNGRPGPDGPNTAGTPPLLGGSAPVAPPVSVERARAFFREHLPEDIPGPFRQFLSDDETLERLLNSRRGKDLRSLIEAIDHDPEMGDLKLREFRAIVRAMPLMRELRDAYRADAGDAEIDAIKAQIAQAVRERFDAVAEVRALELRRLRDRVQLIEQELARSETQRDAIIDRLLAERLDSRWREDRDRPRDRGAEDRP